MVSMSTSVTRILMLRRSCPPFLLFGAPPDHASHGIVIPLERGELGGQLLLRLGVELKHAGADLQRLQLLLGGLGEGGELRGVLLRVENAEEIGEAHRDDALRHEGAEHRQPFLADAVRTFASPTVELEQLQPCVHHLQTLRRARFQAERVHHRVHVEQNLGVRDPTDLGTWWFSERE